jgi:ABC-type transport system involved in cytochrome c biogenesis ATPase subunit
LLNIKITNRQKLPLDYQNLILKTTPLSFEQGDIVFVSGSILKSEFLHFLAGIKTIKGLSLEYKNVDCFLCNKSYQSRGRLFVEGLDICKGTERFNLTNVKNDVIRFKEFLFKNTNNKNSFTNLLYTPQILKLNYNKTLWQNIEAFAKLAKQPEMCYPIVYYFNLEDCIELKLKDILQNKDLQHKIPLISISIAMAFSQIDLWILNLSKDILDNQDNLRITKNLITARAEDSDGIVFYSTPSNEPIEFAKQKIIYI